MEQLNFITNLLGIKDKNIIILDYKDSETHKEIFAKLDYPASKCLHCQGQMAKYDFQKESKIPYLECAGYKTMIRLRKRRFHCKVCGKMAVAETSFVKKNHQIATIVNQKITQKLIEKVPMTTIAESLSVSTSTVIHKLKEFKFKTDLSYLPEHIKLGMKNSFKKRKDEASLHRISTQRQVITILDGELKARIHNHFLHYSRPVRCRVKIITMDMFSPNYDLARQLFPCDKIVLDRFCIVQHLSRAMCRIRVQIMKQSDRKSHENRALKRYWKLIQQDSRKLSHKRFYRPTFRMHLTNQEILDKLLSYSQELKEHYELYQLLLFHFQEKQAEHFFGLIGKTISCINPIFQTVFKTFLKDKDKIINALELPYSNAKLEATNNLIKVIKLNAFGFRNFDNFKTRILIALNIKKERTNSILSRM
ncbi:ISL3 family transposase [Streptococcus anginosus]|uniref:ISL3 family transposase n=1 Tax=Streptococcus anginosus TaxID=1328 RepID=UPI00046D53A1|nr:ISL3 family transposase [Streptococcus anginosus]